MVGLEMEHYRSCSQQQLLLLIGHTLLRHWMASTCWHHFSLSPTQQNKHKAISKRMETNEECNTHTSVRNTIQRKHMGSTIPREQKVFLVRDCFLSMEQRKALATCTQEYKNCVLAGIRSGCEERLGPYTVKRLTTPIKTACMDWRICK
jgi:hypothetical protein